MKQIITTILAITLSFSAFTQNDTMFVHMGQTTLEFPAEKIDSIIFHRTQGKSGPVESVSLEQTFVLLGVGDTLRLPVTILPVNALNKAVAWISSNTAVATVNNGLITALTEGLATITVITHDNNYIATCVVDVRTVVVYATGITLNQTTTILPIGDTLRLTATIEPAGASNKTVIWKSLDPTIATVSNGLITALAGGTTAIVATSQDGNFTDTCKVTVPVVEPINYETIATYLQSSSVNALEAFLNGGTARYQITLMSPKVEQWRQFYSTQFPTFSAYSISLPRGTYQLSVVATYTDGATWYRGPQEIMTAGGQGIIPMTGAGHNPLSDVTFNITRSTVLTSVPAPPSGYNGASTGAISFMNFLGQAAGFTIIQDGATFWFRSKADPNDWFVCVRQPATPVIPVQSVSLDHTSATLTVGSSLALWPIVMPINAHNRLVTWSSSNPAVATVVNGVVNALTAGTANITVTTQSGSHTDTCKIEVVAAQSSAAGVEFD